MGGFRGTQQGIYHTREVSAAEREIGIEEGNRQEAFHATQAHLLGMPELQQGQINQHSLTANIGEQQANLDKLKTDRGAALSGRQKSTSNIGSIENFDKQIHTAEDNIRRLSTVMGNLANNTIALDAAQKKYNLAVGQAKDDLDSRKSDADILTFGSQAEKQQLFQKEQVTQQALQLSPEEFQNLPDQIRKMVGERLKEAPGRFRTVQDFDERRGRYVNTRDVSGEGAIQALRQPALNFLTEPGGAARRLQSNANIAEHKVRSEKADLAARQGALQDVQGKDIGKQAIAAQASFQGFLGDLNKTIEGQMQASQKFLENSAKLTAALESFPSSIKIERSGQVEVIINGSEVIMAAKNDLEKSILESIVGKLEGMIKKGFKDQKAR
jgi:hypothetical protein